MTRITAFVVCCAALTTFQNRRALRVAYLRGRERVTQYFVRTGELMQVVTYTYPLR